MNANYEKAKALLLENKDLVAIKYYNGYEKSISLKVLWCGTGGDVNMQLRIGKLHARLVRLANKTRRGSLGADIYNFAR